MSEDLAARLRRHAEMIKNDDCDAIMAGYHRPQAEATYRYEQQLAFEAAAAELVGLREQLARQAPRHPWGEPPFDGALERASECEMCWASDGDTRCIRCGRSTGGFDVCECPEGALIGPCGTAEAVRALSVPAPPACSTCDGAGCVHLSPTAVQAIICGDCEVQAVR